MSDMEGVPRTSDAAALYRLMAWLSPAYPGRRVLLFERHRMGGRGRRHPDAATLQRWLTAVIGNGGGFCDAAILRPCLPGNGRQRRRGAEAMSPNSPPPSRPRRNASSKRPRKGALSSRPPRRRGHAWRSSRLAAAWQRPARLSGRRGVAAAGHGIALEPALSRLSCRRSRPISCPRACGSIPLGQTDGQRVLGCARAGDRHDRRARAEHAARRYRRRLLPRRHRQHAARDPIHPTVQELTMQQVPMARCGSASAGRSAPARPR